MSAAVSIVGSVLGFIGMQKQEAATEKAEDARKQQMNLDVQRKRREALRQAMLARSVALSNATNQGAQFGSGLAGGLAQITSAGNRNVNALNQDKQLGNTIFDANKEYAQGGMLAGFGSSLSNASNALGRMAGGFGVA